MELSFSEKKKIFSRKISEVEKTNELENRLKEDEHLIALIKSGISAFIETLVSEKKEEIKKTGKSSSYGVINGDKIIEAVATVFLVYEKGMKEIKEIEERGEIGEMKEVKKVKESKEIKKIREKALKLGTENHEKIISDLSKKYKLNKKQIKELKKLSEKTLK